MSDVRTAETSNGHVEGVEAPGYTVCRTSSPRDSPSSARRTNTSQRIPWASSTYAERRYSPAPKRPVISEIAIGPVTTKPPSSVRLAFARAADLVQSPVEARDKRELGRTQRRLDRVDLLILDEVGFVPFDRAGGELLFNTIASRYERRSVLVTTNLSFAEWPKVFGGDEKLTTALLDRLAHHAVVITTRGKSFRMRKRDEPAEEASTRTTKSSKNRAS